MWASILKIVSELVSLIKPGRKWIMESKAAKEAAAQKRRADASIDRILSDAKSSSRKRKH